MKYFTLLSTLILWCFAGAFAQEESLDLQYEVQEVVVLADSIMLNNTQYVSALSVYIPESDAEDARKNWGKRIKNETKSKFVNQKNTTSLYNTLVKEISLTPINVYFSCSKQNKVVKLSVAFEVDTSFVSPTVLPANYASARAFLKEYAVSQYKSFVGEVLKEEKKKLRKVENDMKKLFNESQRFKSIVETRTLGIPHLENDLAENLSFVKMKTTEVTAQMELASQSTGEMKEQEGKKLETLQRERKKIQNEGKKIIKKITRYKSDIEKAEHDIEKNKSEQQLQKQRVKAQLAVVKSVEGKLNKIK